MASKHSRPEPVRKIAVKVANLPKTAVELDLRGRLEQHSSEIVSIHVKDCPTSPVNYAYINCSQLATAEAIVKEVNNKMLLQSNLLTAKIKREQGSQLEAESRPHQVTGAACKDMRVVKVLIHDGDSLTGAELDCYFSRFGELRVSTKIRKGTPDYAYINFRDSMAVQRVRSESPHQILGANIVTVPYQKSKPLLTTPAPGGTRQMPSPAACPRPMHPPYRMPGPVCPVREMLIPVQMPSPMCPRALHPPRRMPGPVCPVREMLIPVQMPSPTCPRPLHPPHRMPTPVQRMPGPVYPPRQILIPVAPGQVYPPPRAPVPVYSPGEVLTPPPPPQPRVLSKKSIMFRCDPLAIRYVREDVLRHFPGSQVKFSVKNSDKVTVCVEVDIVERVLAHVSKSISSHESKLNQLEISLESYYLPILASQSTQQMLAEMQIPFEIKIQHTNGYVSAIELANEYLLCEEEKTVDTDSLKQFLFSDGSQEEDHVSHYQWYWKDDNQCFQPYDADVNAQLENAFPVKATILVTIGKFEYGIKTSKMYQKNLTTRKKREIERRAVVSSPVPEQWNILLRLKAHSDHLQEIEKAVTEEMEKAVKVKMFEVPCIPVEFDLFERLMKVAARAFVSAERSSDQDDAIVLKGAYDVVKDTEMKLKEEILDLRERLSSNVSTPHYWEPQSKTCELKLVKKGSTEWGEIAQRLAKPGFPLELEIVKIERIQNKWLWEVFDNSRRRMHSKNMGQVNEKWLFHGTRSIPPEKIYNSEQGFDNRLASSGMWGTGTYFAVKASYSALKYAYTTSEGHHQVFLAQVITGITHKCPPDRTLKLPPSKPKTINLTEFVDEHYDSVSGDTGSSEVFVIYEHGKVYPAYLITYTFSVSRLRL